VLVSEIVEEIVIVVVGIFLVDEDEVELDLLNIVLGAVELELVKKIGVVVTIKVGLFEVTGSGLLVKVENISVVGILLVDFVLDWWDVIFVGSHPIFW